MPQMSSLFWFNLFILTILMFYIFMCLNFYFYWPKKNFLNFKSKKKIMHWKW
uniref:ATP synthase complex subunit 8 n=1 Tax=Ismarus sp. ZJUH_2016020 TaxID=2491162 RepID=A0A3S8V0Z0_9HYME|nr:ATP synthase F0 subunit 8 [Ismarus sp. ZJUH_2016020]